MVELFGTRAHGMRETSSLVDELADTDSAGRILVASAYWDTDACANALRLGERAGAPVDLVLWTAGGTRAGWKAARDAHTNPRLHLRWIDSPESAGIFHAKLAMVLDSTGTPTCAALGSANLTAAGLGRNVELGVVIRDDHAALSGLHAWFSELFTAALPAERIDWEHAIAIAPERSEAAERKRLFAAAALASPAPARTV